MRSAPAAGREPAAGHRRSRGWGAALLAAALAGPLALAPALTASPPAAAVERAVPFGRTVAQAGPEQVQVVLDAVTPTVLTPQDILAVSGTVSNTGSAPVTDVSIRLRLQRSRLDTRAEVAQWDGAPAGGSAGNRVAQLVLDQPLPAGAEVPFELSVDASSLALPGDGERWGPRGIAVEVVGTVGDGPEQLGLTRSFVTWMPRKEFAPTRLSVLVPLVAPPVSSPDGLVEPATMADLTGAGGRLDALLRATEGLPVDWALDPALLASAAVVAEPAEPGTPEPGTPPAAEDAAGTQDTAGAEDRAGAEAPVTEWLDALRAEAGHREVLALPYADADLEALAGARQPELLSQAVNRGRGTVERLLGEPVRTDVAWPAGGSAEEEDLSVLDAYGYGAAVLDERARPVADRLFYTPDGRADLDAGTSRLDGLLSDARLSAVLAGTGDQRTAPSAPRFLAETAAVTLEQPGRPRHLLVTAPRQWQPDVAQIRGLLKQVQEAPWVELEPLSTLIAADPPGTRRTSVQGPFPPTADAPEPLPPDHLASVARILARIRASGAALTDPDQVVAPLERAAAALTSVAWRGDERGRDAAARSLLTQVEELQQAVRIVPGSSVNVLAERAELPVTVVNDLDQEVDVLVRLRPRSSRLQVSDAVRVRVGAHQREQVRLPIRAVANGNVEVDGVLLTPQGLQLGEAVSMTVRLRADWETRGTAVVAVAMAVLVVAGLVRTIRRGRRPDRGHGGTAPADGSTPAGSSTPAESSTPAADRSPRSPGGEPARAGSGQPTGLAEERR